MVRTLTIPYMFTRYIPIALALNVSFFAAARRPAENRQRATEGMQKSQAASDQAMTSNGYNDTPVQS